MTSGDRITGSERPGRPPPKGSVPSLIVLPPWIAEANLRPFIHSILGFGPGQAPVFPVAMAASAAHLKFLLCKRQTLSRNFKWESGTRINRFASAHSFPKFVKGGC